VVLAALGSAMALSRLMPYGTLIVAALVPLAAGLYLLTSTAWAVTERSILTRRLRPATAPHDRSSPV